MRFWVFEERKIPSYYASLGIIHFPSVFSISRLFFLNILFIKITQILVIQIKTLAQNSKNAGCLNDFVWRNKYMIKETK